MGDRPLHTVLPSHGRPPPPPFSSQPISRKSLEIRPDMMELETERSQRANSVLSGLSADDIQAAETLKSLQQQDMHSPRTQQSTPPQHVQTTTSFDDNEPEPLLSLITSQYPLAASVINGSIGIYKAAQVYTPGGEYIERTVGLPLARKTARISGVESVARWALQPKRDGSRGIPSTPDIEKAFIQLGPDGVMRRADSGEQPPAYNAGDRSPPYAETQVLLNRDQPSQVGWGQQLIITTSGLGIAMSDDSIKSLTYCLQCLRWANGRLGGAVTNLKELLEQWERRDRGSRSMSVSSLTSNETDENALAAKIAAVKADVLSTLQKVVSVVSTYAGGALPENARRLVHQHLVTLPQRFTIASRRSSEEENHDIAASNANKALVLAQEGLDMMNQVSRVVNDTLQSAESWLEKLGRRRAGTTGQQQNTPPLQEKVEPNFEQDTKMEL